MTEIRKIVSKIGLLFVMIQIFLTCFGTNARKSNCNSPLFWFKVERDFFTTNLQMAKKHLILPKDINGNPRCEEVLLDKKSTKFLGSNLGPYISAIGFDSCVVVDSICLPQGNVICLIRK